MNKEKSPFEEGLNNAKERFHKARHILDEAMLKETTFDPSVDWTSEKDEEDEN